MHGQSRVDASSCQVFLYFLIYSHKINAHKSIKEVGERERERERRLFPSSCVSIHHTIYIYTTLFFFDPESLFYVQYTFTHTCNPIQGCFHKRERERERDR